MTEYKLAEFFSGTGAFSLAFENTKKVKCIYSNDFCKNSEKIYNENFTTKLVLKDIHDIKTKDIPKMDILTAGFPCFVSGTQVLTNKGYKNIEDVILSNKLLTHSGFFQNILNLQKKIYSGYIYDIRINYHPKTITSTEEHPYYIREKTKIWDDVNKKYNILFLEPKWKKANELILSDYFGMVINKNNIIPEFHFENIINKYNMEKIYIKLDNLNYWFIIGFLIDKYIIEETIEDEGIVYKIQFTLNNKDDKEIFERINKIMTIINNNCDIDNKFKKYSCSDFIWYNIFKQFGKYKNIQLIPEWVQDAPKEFIQEFINGYVKANSFVNNEILQIIVPTLNMAFGLQRLYLKLGNIFSINKCFNNENIYYITETLKKEKNNYSFIENNYVWMEPLKITKREIIDIAVYNFEVEKDNSYIVENSIVHNCQPFSIAGEQKGFEDERSNTFWKLIKIIDHHKPDVVIFENVKNLQSHDEGKTFKTIIGEIEKIKYNYKYKVLNTCVHSPIPQNRERIYIICFKNKEHCDKFSFQEPSENKLQIKDMFEENIPEKYYYTNSSVIWPKLVNDVINKNVIYQYRRYYVRENKSDVCPTLTANMGSGGHNVGIIKDDKGIRKLTPKECFNFQGFPNNYKIPKLSDSALYKLAGNAVSYPIVETIAIKIIEILSNDII
jgi:DNA (cytosine-5)-methyltransferase 1